MCQRELLAAIWPEDHSTVSHNTFYQTTLNLRRALTQAGYPAILIQTIPKKGLKIPAHVSIEKGATTEPPEMPVKNTLSHIRITGFTNVGQVMTLCLLSAAVTLALSVMGLRSSYAPDWTVHSRDCLVYINPRVPHLQTVLATLNEAGIECVITPSISPPSSLPEPTLATIPDVVSRFNPCARRIYFTILV